MVIAATGLLEIFETFEDLCVLSAPMCLCERRCLP